MAARREELLVALFARLRAITKANGSPYFATASRVFENFDNVPYGDRPALFVIKGDETATIAKVGLPALWAIKADAILYLQDDATTHQLPSASPDTMINDAITRIELALQMQPDEVAAVHAPFVARPVGTFATTLGGLCLTCQIVGTVQVSDGSATGTAIVQIPIEMLTTG